MPLENGEYTVNLHFAEIFWGATGGGQGGEGNRIFDVSIEGNLVLDNYDILADVGPETIVIKDFFANVTDGELNIDFSSLASVGGIDQPKLSALEVLRNSVQGIPIVVNEIPDQLSAIGEQLDGSLVVEASGGEGNLSYSALNLPPGLFIEPTNGQIGGTVSEDASSTTPYTVTITVNDSDDISTDAVTVNFLWYIIDNSSSFNLRINAGGPLTLNDDEVFSADQYFSNGLMYLNNSAQVPELYKTERSSPSRVFSYNIPLENGDYSVTLHFAEIYWGATGGDASGGEGSRIFDVAIEGDLVLDNNDIFAEVGAETPVIKVFPVTVLDEQLNIDFSAMATDGGIDQPKVSAIEVTSNTLSNNNLNFGNNFTVFPNPMNGVFYISTRDIHGDEVEVTVYNIAGQTMYSSKITVPLSGFLSIELPELSSGMFLINLVHPNKGKFNAKLINH
ncbi:malectin domain-containing carbohydrate-binding protein [Paucihalobacter sp.]|uniref:malectin domain-containing carbohydrate-binding protein n=1 Tax=Paucihalobacter sp. TaxID=2850405 RepID=UPI003D1614A1